MATTRPRLIRIRLHRELDTDPDLSYLGEYTDELKPWNILRAADEYVDRLPEDSAIPARGREYRAFQPVAGDERPGSDDYCTYGMQDYERMEAYTRGRWYMVGVYATATIVLPSGASQTIRSGGIWGVESDSDASHFEELETHELAQLRSDLEALGIARPAILRALKAKERAA